MRPLVAIQYALFVMVFMVLVLYEYGSSRSISISSELRTTMTKDSGERQTSYVASAFQAEKISLPEEVGGKVEELAESNYVQEWEPAVVVAEGIEEPIPVEVPETRIPKYIKGIQVQYPNPESLNIQAQEEHEIMASSSKNHYPPNDRPYVVLNGFSFCDILDNATFFTDLELNIFGDYQNLTSENANLLIRYIDSSAQEILDHPDIRGANFQRETLFTNEFSSDTLKRGICWNVAQGNLQWWKPCVKFGQDFTTKHGGRVLRTIDSNAALHFLNYDRKQPIAEIESKPHYRLAYVVLVHYNAGNVAALIDALADPSVFIYIHIDLSAPENFHHEVLDLIKDRPHIALMPTAFSVAWSHVSIVWVEVRAFFDLLDLISFDYVINLSGSDYPLKSADTIFHHLEQKPGSNWMWWAEPQAFQFEYRMLNMFHCREYYDGWDKKCAYFEPYGQRSFDGYEQLFPHRYKTSQWVVLHRSAVEYLRSSEAGKLLLMHSEHTQIPDEMFFSTFFAASPFVGRTFRDPKRLMFWYGGAHPYDWTNDDADVIRAWSDNFLWIRKVDPSNDPELKVVLDDIRREDKMSTQLVLKYQGGAGIIPVD